MRATRCFEASASGKMPFLLPRLRPAWDCHGLPIELKALQSASNKASVDERRQRCREFCEQSIERQKADMHSWGLLLDHANPIKTMSNEYEVRELCVFAEIVERGLVYEDLRPVHWSTSSSTALAEAELEHADTLGVQAWFAFPTSIDGCSALVWTTTPWSLPANVAIAYSPRVEYVKVVLSGQRFIMAREAASTSFPEAAIVEESVDLVGLTYGQGRPFIPADFVTSNGTGLVHVAPCYGLDDFALSKRHGLATIDLLNDDGSFTSGQFQSLSDANDFYLKQAIRHAPYIHKDAPIDWRTKQPTIVRCTRQWFIDIRQKQGGIEEAVEAVTWIPEGGRQRMLEMLRLRDQWCISRQRAWGVPIPAIIKDGRRHLDPEIIRAFAARVEREGGGSWYSLDTEGAFGFKKAEPVETLDVWFDSGTMWASGDKQADLCIEGIDQFRGWFQSSLLTSVLAGQRAPFQTLLAHGFILDAQGGKMSKSLGNVVEPSEIASRYGLDVLRYWVASSDWTKSVTLSEEHLRQAAAGVQSIRSVLRFMKANLYDFDDPVAFAELRTLDRIALALTHQLIGDTTAHMNAFNFQQTCSALQLFLQDFSANYLDSIKDRLYCSPARSAERRSAQTALFFGLNCLNRLVYPLAPILAEEVHGDPSQPIGLSDWPAPLPFDPELLTLYDTLRAIKAHACARKSPKDKNRTSFVVSNFNAIPPHELNEILQGVRTDYIAADSSAPFSMVPGTAIGVNASVSTDYECPRCWLAASASPDGLCLRCQESCLKVVP